MLLYLILLLLLLLSFISYRLLKQININTSSKILITSFKDTYLKTGLPIILITLSNKKQYSFIVDTGANANIISKAILEELNNPKHYLTQATSVSHINGVKADLQQTDVTFHINSHKFKETFIVTEFTEAYNIINKHGNIEIAGILGSKFLNKYKLKVLFANYTITK